MQEEGGMLNFPIPCNKASSRLTVVSPLEERSGKKSRGRARLQGCHDIFEELPMISWMLCGV